MTVNLRRCMVITEFTRIINEPLAMMTMNDLDKAYMAEFTRNINEPPWATVSMNLQSLLRIAEFTRIISELSRVWMFAYLRS